MRLPNSLRYFLFRLLIPVALYVLVVIGGTVAFLCIAPIFGYLGYSDRPGPGWFGHFPAVTWSEFRDNAQSIPITRPSATSLVVPQTNAQE